MSQTINKLCVSIAEACGWLSDVNAEVVTKYFQAQHSESVEFKIRQLLASAIEQVQVAQLEKRQHALEVQHLDELTAQASLAQAQASLAQAQASLMRAEAAVKKSEAASTATLLRAIEHITDAAIQIGPVLIVKLTDANGESSVQVRTLTVREMRYLDEHQTLLTFPRSILLRLSNIGQTEEAPFGSTHIERGPKGDELWLDKILAEASPENREALLLENVVKMLAQRTGYDPKHFEPTDTFASIGSDSLTLIELQHSINTSLGIRISFSELFQDQSIQQFVEHTLGLWSQSRAHGPMLELFERRAADPRPG